MSFIISAYSEKGFREYQLPSLLNADYSIVLEKSIFQLDRNYTLEMEVIDSVWKLKKTREYSIDNVLNPAENNKIELKDHGLYTISVHGRQLLYLFTSDVQSQFSAYQKYDISRIHGSITIGRGDDNVIQYNFPDDRENLPGQYKNLVSTRHAEIIREHEKFWLSANPASKNPTYLNKSCVEQGQKIPLNFGDQINILGLHLVFLGTILAVDETSHSVAIDSSVLKEYRKEDLTVYRSPMGQYNQQETNIFHRSPRHPEHLDHSVIEIETPPELPQEKEEPLFMAIGPAATMSLPMMLGCFMMVSGAGSSGLYMYSGLVMSLSSAIVGVFWGLKNIQYQRKEREAKRKKRFDAYSKYLSETTDAIRGKYESTIDLLKRKYPAASECVQYNGKSAALWNRNNTHDDFITHRLGIGDIPFQVNISVPKKRFRIEEDELAEKPAQIRQEFEKLYHVPVTLNLAEHPLIGVIGGAEKWGALEIARALSVQIAANNCYTDIKLVYVYNGSSSEECRIFDFAKWLPHVWSENHKTRFLVSSAETSHDVFYTLANVFRNRLEEGENKRQGGKVSIPKPYYIVFISDPRLLEGEPVGKYLFGSNAECGVTTFLLAETEEDLPNTCSYVIQNDQKFQGIYHLSDQEDEKVDVKFDTVSEEDINQFASDITALRVQEIEDGGEIPDGLSFFEMYNVKRPEDFPVEEWWAKNKIYENIRGLLGQKAGGKDCYLDVHEKYHGPHGLIAGTTGSGKSETLQTYLMSLALHYSPDDIGFFIIDYKGGGMGNLFEGLPHLIGQISNLSGNQVDRAMISIKSENRRREAEFAKHGVNNINAYTKMYKNGEATEPIPHLFIIIDEFAQLNHDKPDFMHELIAVAQVGRSLGVHLILATQKPSNTVDDNIWSNSKFRLCLRVQDRQDSMEMLHKPDAAYITQAGRGYLQVGNDEIYEQFQSGYSGAIYEESLADSSTDIAKLLRLDGSMEISGSMAKKSLKDRVQKIWIGKLLDCMNRALDSMETTSEDILDSDERMEELHDLMYEELSRDEIEYADNEYNRKRLYALTDIYLKLPEDTQDKAGEVLRIAADTDVRLPEAKEKTQLDAVREYLGQVAIRNGYTFRQVLWMPVLEKIIYLNHGETFYPVHAEDIGNEWSMPIVIGKFDDPAYQDQPDFKLDLAVDDNVAVIGTITSGKSTMLQTIAWQLITGYAPDVVNIYGLDFSNHLLTSVEDAPHVRKVYYDTDVDELEQFFRNMEEELEARKDEMRGGSFSQYIQKNGICDPALVVFIDNFGGFMQKTEGRFENEVIRLSKEGVNHGIYMIISDVGFGQDKIISRVADNLKTVIGLQLQEKYEYADLMHVSLDKLDTMPETGVKGRGLAKYDGRILEFQAGVALQADNDYQRNEKMREICAQMNPGGKKIADEAPVSRRKLKKLTWEQLMEQDGFMELSESRDYLPVGCDMASGNIYSIPLRDTLCYMICGDEGSGKTNMMRVCMNSALLKQGEVVIIDSEETPLYEDLQDIDGITYINTPQGLVDFLKPGEQDGFNGMFVTRNKRKKQISPNGENDDAVFDELSEETPYYIFIADFPSYIAMVQNTGNINETYPASLSKILAAHMQFGRKHNIYYFAEVSNEQREKSLGAPEFNAFEKANKTGIHLGGMTVNNMSLDFDYLVSEETCKKENPGIGYQSIGYFEKNQIKKVIIPVIEE